MRTACRTVVAMATEDGQTGNDVVPRLYIAYLGAYGFDDTSGFVAEHDGGRTGVEPLLKVHVAVADTRRRSPHADLVGAWGANIHIFYSQWLMHSAKNGCFHCCLLLRILELALTCQECWLERRQVREGCVEACHSLGFVTHSTIAHA